jgi:hypothetical protein
MWGQHPERKIENKFEEPQKTLGERRCMLLLL